MTKPTILSLLLCLTIALTTMAQKVETTTRDCFLPGRLWFDTAGKLINAHGGGILFHNGKYYWYGEHKGEMSNNAHVGVTVYSSHDLYNWTSEGIALTVSDDPASPIANGCIIERPKVIYNTATRKFVMYFHLELKDRGYAAANVGVAVSDNVTGPFRLLKHGRVNAGQWPLGMTAKERKEVSKMNDKMEWWTPQWHEAVNKGLFVARDISGGQMARDMTLFIDDDGKAYHIYSSEDNLTIHIAELTADYLDYTGRYIRIDPAGHNEAPAIFKKDGRYYMITSGCTGWRPNAARLLTADSIFGTWTRHNNPCRGKETELTFRSQGTFILPVQGKKDAFIFLADRWKPENPIDGRYVWLPIEFEDGMPVLRWHDRWTLSTFGE